jgi:uncharacterized cupredoxin-like copper-binding protein
MHRTTTALVGVLLVTGTLAAVSAHSAVPAERTVELTVHHSRFSIDELHVQRGQRVRFVVRNTDPIDHELIVGDTSTQSRHEMGAEPWHGSRPGEVSVPIFTTRETTYTFREAGTYWFGCHLPGHWTYGMKGQVHIL